MALSFDKRVAFYTKWKALFPAILLVAALFIVWDIWFTQTGVWDFNPEYLTGIYLAHLPLEEWLFFFTVPYACVFIYECIRVYLPCDLIGQKARYIFGGLALILLLTAALHFSKMYTAVTFISLAGVLIWMLLRGFPAYMGYFLIGYLVHLIPFFIVNGILTSYPVVIYNDAENLAIRLGTIPVEDTMYSMLLLLLNVGIFEYLRSYFQLPQPVKATGLPFGTK